MTVVINEKKFDRFWTIVAGFLCLLALVLTMIALRTSSWTITENSDGEVRWNGLFYSCDRFRCTWNYRDHFPVLFLTILSCLFLVLSTIFIFLMGVHSFPRRHFYLTPTVAFIGALLLLISMLIYAREYLTNGISARLVITALVLMYACTSIAIFIAGRYSIIYRANPIDFTYRKTETNETVEKLETKSEPL